MMLLQLDRFMTATTGGGGTYVQLACKLAPQGSVDQELEQRPPWGSFCAAKHLSSSAMQTGSSAGASECGDQEGSSVLPRQPFTESRLTLMCATVAVVPLP